MKFSPFLYESFHIFVLSTLLFALCKEFLCLLRTSKDFNDSFIKSYDNTPDTGLSPYISTPDFHDL